MMDILAALTDDQKAIMGCIGVFTLSGIVMALSYYINPAHRRVEREKREAAETLKFPEPTTTNTETTSDQKAA